MEMEAQYGTVKDGYTRFACLDPSASGRCFLVFQNLPASKGLTAGYSGWDVQHCKMDVKYLKPLQKVVVVDNNELSRGFIVSAHLDQEHFTVFCLDIGQTRLFKANQIYAPYVSDRLFDYHVIPCFMNNLKLFSGTKLLQEVLMSMLSELKCRTLRKTTCVGILNEEEPGAVPVPIMDLWPYGENEPESKTSEVPFNMLVAQRCADQWISELKKAPGSAFPGSVAHIAMDGKVSIQYASGLDDTHAVYMDMYLAQYKPKDLETFIPVNKQSAVKGIAEKTIYLTEFEEDSKLYRVRILEAEWDENAQVEFIDYGNTASVPYFKIYEAGKIDKVLGILPPLVFHAYMFGVDKVLAVDETLSVLQDADDVELTICAGLRLGYPLVSITGKEADGDGSHNLFKTLVAKSYIVPIHDTAAPYMKN